MTKDSGMRIRIERELREKFLNVCRAQDRPASQVVREFMREYVANHIDVKSSEKPREPGSERATNKVKQ